jgi:hypothetical protein
MMLRTCALAAALVFMSLAAAAAAPCAAGKKPCASPHRQIVAGRFKDSTRTAQTRSRRTAHTRSRDWYLHRPSTTAEREETAQLNRQFHTAANAPVPVAPPMREARIAPPPPPYGSQMDQYRDLRDAYDRQLRAYYRAFPSRDSERQASAQPPAPYYAPDYRPAPYYGPGPGYETTTQDAGRLDPWRGYNPYDGPGNGY